MIGDSLRLRLLGTASIAVAAALTVAWGAMSVVFEQHIEKRVVDELRNQAVPLLAGLSVAPDGTPVVTAQPADPRFDTPTSGLYWQARTAAGEIHSRSLWDSALPSPAGFKADAWTRRGEAGPFGQNLLLIERQVRPDQHGLPVVIQLGYDLAGLRTAKNEFREQIGLFLVLLWAGLSAAAWAQVSLGLRPLRRVAVEVGQLRADSTARFAGSYPRELRPLTQAIDALADAREADVARARRRAADLAHGLKTPLSALAALSRRAREAGAGAAADGLDQAIAAVRAAVDGELARTRIGLAAVGRRTPAEPLIERLINVIEHSELGNHIVFAVDVSPTVELPLAGDDAAELIGPLLDNAARHARRQVAVIGDADDKGLWITISDDGPGLDAARHGEAVLRGARLDSAGDGHGLGLAIARELTEATGGVLALGQAALGGLEVRLAWTRP